MNEKTCNARLDVKTPQFVHQMNESLIKQIDGIIDVNFGSIIRTDSLYSSILTDLQSIASLQRTRIYHQM